MRPGPGMDPYPWICIWMHARIHPWISKWKYLSIYPWIYTLSLYGRTRFLLLRTTFQSVTLQQLSNAWRGLVAQWKIFLVMNKLDRNFNVMQHFFLLSDCLRQACQYDLTSDPVMDVCSNKIRKTYGLSSCGVVCARFYVICVRF